jgi:hypothetical protein
MCKQQIIEIIKATIHSLETEDWSDLREQIITNFLEIDFMKLIQDYKPCSSNENDLYLSESELMDILDTFTFYKLQGLQDFEELVEFGLDNLKKKPKNNDTRIYFPEFNGDLLMTHELCENIENWSNEDKEDKEEVFSFMEQRIQKLPSIFTKLVPNKILNYFIGKREKTLKKEDTDLLEEEIKRFLETGTKILIRKQQNKYINVSYSTCPVPETGEPLSFKTYYKLDKFVKNEKFNYLNKKGISFQINTRDAKTGLKLYEEMKRNNYPHCEIFAYPANLIQLYMLYLSLDGNMYILFTSYGFLTYYLLITDDSWFRNQMY